MVTLRGFSVSFIRGSRSMFRRKNEAAPPGIVLVQYPGIIKNAERALQTMGGIEKMSQSHKTGVALELRHTPDNPFTSRCFSTLTEASKVTSGTVRLALKIRRKKTDKSRIEIKSLGFVTHMYRFSDMCDFQYLPLKKKAGTDHYDDLLPRLIPTNIPAALSWWERMEPDGVPLFLPPYQFSRYNTPSQKILCRDIDHQSKSENRTIAGKNMRKTRLALSITVQTNDEFPTEPSEAALEDANARCKAEEPHRIMKKLFDDRPMWTRVGIAYVTGLDDTILKTLLPKFAFYILSGPWGRLWCRFGYDPRSLEEAKKYQTVMVSFRQNNYIPEKGRLRLAAVEKPAQDIQIDYRYEKGRIPHVRQMWYCLCDIGFKEVMDLLAKDFSHVVEPGVKAASGWIPQTTINEVRDLIKADVKKQVGDIEATKNEDGPLAIEDIW